MIDVSDGSEVGAIPAWLEAPPSSVPPPLTITAPQQLAFGDLSAENFERLVLALARLSFPGTRSLQYGEPGQKQDGIDLYVRLTAPECSDSVNGS